MRGRKRLVLASAAVVAAGTATAVAVEGSAAGQSTSVPHYLFPNAGNKGGAIELSSNGGRTWHVVLRTPRPVVGLVPNGSYVSARLDDGETLESRDAGRTWLPSSTPLASDSSVCPLGLYIGSNGGDPSWSLCTTQGGAGNEGKAVYRDFVARGWKRVACTNFSTSHFLCGKHPYGGISGLGYPLGIAGSPRSSFGIIWESRGTI